MHTKNRRSPLSVAPALACALAIAACGSSGNSSTTNTASGYSQALKFANCMRAHGLSNFPDPSSSGRLTAIQADPRSPVFQSAQQACQKYSPLKFGPATHLTASQRQAALRFSECMRTHGEPSFPDPAQNVPAPSPGTRVLEFAQKGAFVLGPGIDPASPAFRQAAASCGLKPPNGGPAPK
jgi:hypothetical protein